MVWKKLYLSYYFLGLRPIFWIEKWTFQMMKNRKFFFAFKWFRTGKNDEKITFEVIFMYFKSLSYAKILKTDLKYSKLDHRPWSMNYKQIYNWPHMLKTNMLLKDVKSPKRTVRIPTLSQNIFIYSKSTYIVRVPWIRAYYIGVT